MKVLIKKARAFNIATVALLNSRGSIVPTDLPMAVRFPSRYAETYEAGSVWDVRGKIRQRSYRVDGMTITEDLVEARQVVRICPEGPAIATWMEQNVPGIGEVTAMKVVRVIKNLNQTIQEGDIETLCSVDGMTANKAHELITRWPDEKLYSSIRFLADCGLPARLASPITKLYKTRVEELIRSDPYILTSLGIPFSDVESLIHRLGIQINEDDRNTALVEEATHQISMHGSTVISSSEIESYARKIGFKIDKKAQLEAVKRGLLVRVNNGFQTLGMAQMEIVTMDCISRLIKRKPGEEALLAGWELDICTQSVEKKLAKIQQHELGFQLTEEQRNAVIGSVLSPVACISGGAGVGKTTILKAILGAYKAFSSSYMNVHLLALSGRAAQRISQSTNYPAQTIAKYIFDSLEKQKTAKEDHALIVIDEASMVDLHTMYKLVRVIPNATRLLFMGDTAQLPPVGPGLIFHELVKSGIPTFNLTAVKRQSAESGIHKFATLVRAGKFRQLPGLESDRKNSPDCCHTDKLDMNQIKNLWEDAGRSEASIILSPTNAGNFGVDNVNASIQDYIGTARPKLRYMDEREGIIPWQIKGRFIHLGDQVMVTSNDYKNDIRNGDLATIIEVYDRPTESGHYGTMHLEGKPISINDEVIEKLDLGFCVTIHKAQGSQWPVVIMLLTPEGEAMTDRSLLYTGSTRPQERLVILGSVQSLEKAIARGNFSDARKVAIRELLPQLN